VTDASAVKDARRSPRFGGFIDGCCAAPARAIAVRTHSTRPRSRRRSSPRSSRAANIWLLLQDRSARGRPTREQRFAEELRQGYPEVRIRDASPILLARREIKSDAELTLIQRAVDVTVEAQKAATAPRRLLPGVPVDRRRRARDALHYETNDVRSRAAD